MAFAWLVMRAAWRPTKVRYKGHDIALQRGELSISVRDFAEAMDRPKGWAERLLSRLRDHGMIAQKNGTQVGTQVGTHGGTVGGTPASVITICNYEAFQTVANDHETPNKTARETAARQRQDTEQVREEEKKEAIASCLKRAFVVPDDIPAEPWAAWEEMRKRLRKVPTDKARALAITELRRLRDEEGWPPGDVLNHCTMNSYQGIFPPRRNHSNERDNRDPTTVALERLIGNVGADARTG
jgi:hypothetical protein